MYHLALFQHDGQVFPCRIGIETRSSALIALNWQKIGMGGSEDWRIIEDKELVGLLDDDRLSLGAFTKEARQEKIKQIELLRKS